MVLLAAFKTLLYRYTDQETVSVGSPIANRALAETEDIIGFFANTLVLRTSFQGEPSLSKILLVQILLEKRSLVELVKDSNLFFSG